MTPGNESTATDAGALTMPTHDALGAPLTARQQFDVMLHNPTWAQQATVPGTAAFQQRTELDARMIAEIEGADPTAIAPAQSGAEYVLPWRGTESAEELALDGPIRSWLQTAGFDGRSGTSIAETAADLSCRVGAWSDADFTRHANESRAVLASVHGEQLEAKLEAVADLLHEVETKHPELASFLESQPWLVRDSIIVNQLITIAEARTARRG